MGLTALLLLACIGAGSALLSAQASAGVIRSAETLPCDETIGTVPPPSYMKVVLGVVALPASPKAPALQTERTGSTARPDRLFAKTGLVVRAGAHFQVIVPAKLSRRLALGWGNSAPSAHRVVVKGCKAKGNHKRWLDYAGGFFVQHPACVSVVVKAGKRERRIRVGLGTPCHGQRRPQGPTQR